MEQHRQPKERRRSGLVKPKVKQACDSCRTRKIRCDGSYPCANCAAIPGLRCTFLTVHKKTGPKGPRRRTSSRPSVSHAHDAYEPSLPLYSSPAEHPVLHAFQDERSSSAVFSPTTSGDHSTCSNFDDDSGTIGDDGSPDKPPPPPMSLPVTDADISPAWEGSGFQPSPELTADVVSLCMETFFKYKYPITPVLDYEETKASLPCYTSSPELYGLVAACCAVMVLSPGILKQASPPPLQSLLLPSPSSPPSDAPDSPSNTMLPEPRFLISEALRARRFCTYTEHPSLNSIRTSFFLFSAYFCLGEDNPAWFHLREAITLLQLLRFHEESTYTLLYSNDSALEAVYARRMFWVLFITERAYALQRNRVLTLQATIELPSVESDADAPTIRGFLNLISLFRNFDEGFVALWNQSSTASASEKPLVKLQNILAYALPTVSGCTKSQLADLLVSREWLKTIVWQLCVSKSMLSSSSSEESMSFRYPISIARDVVLVSRLLPPEAFEANGVGILEKIFDIGCSLSDVISLQSGFAQPSAFEVGPRDCLVELVRIVGSFGVGFKNAQILASKAADCMRTSIDKPLLISNDDPDEYRECYEI